MPNRQLYKENVPKIIKNSGGNPNVRAKILIFKCQHKPNKSKNKENQIHFTDFTRGIGSFGRGTPIYYKYVILIGTTVQCVTIISVLD